MRTIALRGCCATIRPAKERLRRYFRLSSRQSESDTKLASHRSVEDSVTQENTTETLDEPVRIYHTQSAEKPTPGRGAAKPATAKSQLKPRGSKSSVHSASRTRGGHRDNATSIEKKHLNDELNVSSSIITTSTYCNGNGVSNSSGIAVDFDSNECRPLCDRESVYSGVSGVGSDKHLLRSREILTENERMSLRRESSSTYEHDMDMIDLLERERSMDIQDMLAKERRTERERERIRHAMARKNSAADRHRKLPDITKINAPHSPKRAVVSIAQSSNIPNFVFTHQQQSVAEQKTDRTGRHRGELSGGTARRQSKRNSDALTTDNAESAESSAASKGTVRRDSNESHRNSTKSTRDGRRQHGTKHADNLYFDDL